MNPITPHCPGHATLPPLASRFVDVDSLPWESNPAQPGIETRTLLFDRTSGLLTMLVRMAPGAELPDHEHVLVEQSYVLQGSLVCGEGECREGDYVWRPAGSRHTARGGAEGCLLLGMFQIPNRFFAADGRTVDARGNDWETAWGIALQRYEQARFG